MSNFVKLGIDNKEEIDGFQDLENKFIDEMESAFVSQMHLLFAGLESMTPQEVNSAINDRFEASFSVIEQTLTAAMIDFFREGTQYTDSLISDVIPNFSTQDVDIEEIRQYVKESMDKIKETSRKRLLALLALFLGGAYSISWLIEQYMKIVVGNRASAIINYESIRLFNIGIIRVSEMSGFVINLIWNTVGDDRVCPICKPRDGLLYPVSFAPAIPAHFGCRCRWGIVVDKRRIINVYLGF